MAAETGKHDRTSASDRMSILLLSKVVGERIMHKEAEGRVVSLSPSQESERREKGKSEKMKNVKGIKWILE